MAHKMKGFPMMDTSSKHGTNANYKKSGPPNLLGKLMDPLGMMGKAKSLFGGKNKPCPPAQPAAPVPAPDAPAQPAAPAPVAAAAPDPAAAVPMKKNLKVGAPKLEDKNKNKDKNKNYSVGAQNLLKAVPNREAYNKLSDMDKKGFDKAAKRAGLPMQKTK
jgi:hypothetical protein